MAYRNLACSLLVAGLMATAATLTGCSVVYRQSQGVRLEHVALNVEDPEAMVKWYCENLSMKLMRKGPPPVNMSFISDAGGNMMLELYHNPDAAVPDYRAMDPLQFHIAFMVDDVEAACRRLTAAGATVVQEPYVTPAGDQIGMLRDPWGVPIQPLKRAKPMLSHK